MSEFVKLDLEIANGNYLHFNEDYLKAYKQELLEFLDGQDFMKSLSFAKRMMMGQEIKANNTIEGIKDDLSIIEEVIRMRKKTISKREETRIINLYRGYQYILTQKEINKENLKNLYSLLSNGILEPSDEARMGLYYRTAPVYILKGSHLCYDSFMGMNDDKIEYYMNQFFEYVNSDLIDNSEIDIFIKSQIMHFYFVYIHPYFDVNGRTSRTVSMWYLLNHETYPYIIFNRAIAFAKREYEQNIIKGRNHGDITLFLKYILVQVERELEKEYLIHNIAKNSSVPLSKEDAQMIDYLLSMKGNITAKDLATMYNNYNEHRKPSEIFDERILPLLESGVLINLGYTKGFIKRKEPNLNIGINPSILNIDSKKVKHLNLKNCLVGNIKD